MTNDNKNIKQKLADHEFDYNPAAWKKMEQILDDGTPNRSYFFTKTFLAMTTVLFILALLLMQRETPHEGRTTTPQTTPQAFSQEKTTDNQGVAQATKPAAKDLTGFKNLSSLPTAPPNHQSPITSDQDSSFFQKLTRSLSLHTQATSPEKVYLQFDRLFFEPGEDIWFNAYVRDANSLKASPKSDILYVELVGPNGSVLKKIKLLAKGGTAAGDFKLEPTAPGGIYKIRAYTNWMRNTNDAFERDVQVQATVLPRLRMELDFMKKAYGPGDVVEAKLDLNTLANQPLANHDFMAKASLDGQQFKEVSGKTDGQGHAQVKFELPKGLETNDGLLNILIGYNGQTESISRSIPIVLNKIDLQFMPEGGDMVAGLPATVAFKALNEWGKPADVSGKIVNSKGVEVADFQSYHQGMGAFNFTPANGETYHAILTKPAGIAEKYGLADAFPRGFSMKINPLQKDELTVEINSTEDEALNVVLQSRGDIWFTQTLPARAGSHFVRIPVKNMPIGIAQVTLFDSRELPRAERLVFLNHDKQLKISVKTDKEKYLPREKVTMTVQVTDERGIAMPGQFSLAVADDNLLTFADDRQGHILSHLLLESELKGKVEEPNFYFEPKEKHPEKNELLALDYLMLTQGWRRLAWEEMLEGQPVAMEFEGETYETPAAVIDLEEVVVTGYGVVTKRDMTASISSVQKDELKPISKSNQKAKGNSNKQETKITPIVSEYKRPMIEQDKANQGPLTSDQIKQLPTRDVIGLASMAAGVSSADDGAELKMRGSRSDAPLFVIDGVKVEPVIQLDQSISEEARVAIFDNAKKAPHGNVPGMPAPPPPPPAPTDEEDEIFKVVEKQPEFQGGKNALSDFIRQNLNYPVQAKESSISGRVYVNFTIEKDGSISDPKIVRDLGGGTGEEALRIVDLMDGMWKPSYQRGRPVRAQYNLPISFDLDANKRSYYPNLYTTRQFYAPKYEAEQAIPDGNLRTDFRKTVFFAPKLEVGRNGRATVEFYNTDAISTFRATVEGISSGGGIGRTEQRFFTQMPFSMDVKAPVNLLTGDKLAFPLALTNNTDKAITGKLSVVMPAGFSLVKNQPQTVTLKPGESTTIYPEYEVALGAKSGEMQVGFEANGISDAFTQALKVQPRGFPVDLVFGGNDKDKTFSVPVKDVVEGSLSASFTVHPSVLSDLTTGMERMLGQPNGCFEQTSSTNYPNILVLNLLKTTGNANAELEKKANGFLDYGYKRLKTFEIPGGGFDWFASPPAHEALSAYGLMEFVDMKSVYPVEQDLIDRTAQWLLTRRDGKGGWLASKQGAHSWQQPNPVSDAYITWAMTEAGYGKQVSAEIAKQLKDARETQDPYIVALAAKSLLNLGDRRTEEFLAILTKTQASDGSWTGRTQSMTQSTGKNLTVETTALATLAFLANSDAAEGGASGAEMAIVDKAVRYLAGAKTQYGFGSTQGTVLALKALVANAKNMKKSMGGEVQLFVNGQSVGKRPFTADERNPLVFNNLEQYFTEGKNEVKVKFAKGDPLPYDLSVKYSTTLPYSNPDCKLAMKTILSNPAVPSEIRNPKSEMGGTLRLTATLTNRAAEAVPNPIAIVGIPAGLSVQPWQVKQMRERGLFDFYEIKDSYVVFYFRGMSAGEVKTLSLDLKADVPGEYEAPASAAWLYYSNDAVVWSKPERVRIGY